MKPTLVIAMLLGVCLMASLAPVHAATIAASMDAYIDNAAPDNPLGANDPSTLYVLQPNNRDTRTLVQFDSLPPASTIATATLKLQVNPGLAIIGVSQTVSAYRVTTPWNDLKVTWNYANITPPELAWTTPGGDYDPTVQGFYTESIDPYNTLTTLSIDITPLVKGWADGTYANYGVILKGSNGVMLAFYSMTNPGQGPTLDIQTVVPEPFSLALLAFGGLLLFKRR
jgi:hypothetical protein